MPEDTYQVMKHYKKQYKIFVKYMTILNITWYKNTIIVPKDTIISQNRRSWRLYEKGVLPNHDWHQPMDRKPWNEVSITNLVTP